MVLSAPAALRIAAGALLLTLLFAPSVGAQAPPLPPLPGVPTGSNGTSPSESFIALFPLCPSTFLDPTYAGQDTVTCEMFDNSRDCLCAPGSGSGQSTRSHLVTFEWRPNATMSANATGWQVVLPPPLFVDGAERVPFDINVKATPLINSQDFHFDLLLHIETDKMYNETLVVPFVAEVQNYDFAVVSFSGQQAQKAGQDDVVVYEILVQNTGVYPDSYRFSIDAKPDIRVSVPANVYIPPGESRIVPLQVLTPHGKLYEMGRSETIGVKVASVSGSGLYSTTAILQIRGAYIPIYWLPLLLVGLVSGAVVIRGERQRAELHRLEKGRPRRVDLTPRQQVLLAELRRSDPDTYKQKKGAIDTVYKERAADFRDHRKERAQKDKEEAKLAHAEFVAQKKARKAQRAEAKRAEKLAKKEAKREAKLLKKKEKELAKTRAVLLKRKAKADKAEAKVAAKQAKLDAKQAAADAKAAAKAEKDAKKAEKAARKAEKKQKPE